MMSMKPVWPAMLLVAIICLAAGNPALGGTADRQALVIGVRDYASPDGIAPAVHNTADLAKLLVECGFQVDARTDLTGDGIREAIRAFGQRIAHPEAVGLIYYTGHTVQMDGENYLVPPDAGQDPDSQAPWGCIPVSDLLQQMAAAGNKADFLFLDAGRNHDVLKNVRGSILENKRRAASGLARIDSADEHTVIVFAAMPGRAVNDDDGARNSLLAAALIKHLPTPGQPVPSLIDAVTREVGNATGSRQRPWHLPPPRAEPFYFVPAGQGPDAETPAPAESPSGPAPGTSITNSIGQTFVLIPAGTFVMGSDADEPGRDEDEDPFTVTISKDYYLQTTEVTQKQWRAVMGNNPSTFAKCGDNCPVERVSWQDAVEFIARLNKMEGVDTYRLPTEAEWEYAARAGTTTPFYHGRCLGPDQANYNGYYPYVGGCPRGDFRKTTVPVGGFPANPWGLYDMAGNVFEHCSDWYGPYPKKKTVDPEGRSSGTHKVMRGGSWNGYARNCRSAERFMAEPSFRQDYVGFRLARTR